MSTQSTTSKADDDWRPTCDKSILQIRAAMLRQIRTFFDAHDYLEVETPLLSSDVVVDAHIDAFETTESAGTSRSFLQTSPEAAMKRLLAADVGSVFQIARSFRPTEIGPLHNPEFTIVEWYGVNSNDVDQIKLTELLVREVADAVQTDSTISKLLDQTFEVKTYDDAFDEHLGFRVLDLTETELATVIRSQNLLPEVAELPIAKDDLLNLLLAQYVEPKLGHSAPVFLNAYPVSQAALAEVSATDTRVAHRFELYLSGVELCNGYRELTDASILGEREQLQNEIRTGIGKDSLPGAVRLRNAMLHGLPPCSGVALGFDRLVMLLCGRKSDSRCDAISRGPVPDLRLPDLRLIVLFGQFACRIFPQLPIRLIIAAESAVLLFPRSLFKSAIRGSIHESKSSSVCFYSSGSRISSFVLAAFQSRSSVSQ